MTSSKFINNSLIFLTILAFFTQLFIDFSSVNIATSAIIFCSALSTILYLRWSSALDTSPLSTFAIFGFSFTTVIGAIWAQSVSLLPVSGDLHQPIVTFSWLALFQAISIVAHMFYRSVWKSTNSINSSFLTRVFDSIGIYALQPPSVLWFVGVLGLFCVLLSKVFPVANGLSFLAWAPFLIPGYNSQIGKGYCNITTQSFFLVLHASVIALLAMFFNSRGVLLSGFATLGLIFLVAGMRSQKKISSAMFFRLAVLVIVIGAISSPVTKLVTAMAIARYERAQVSPIKTIENTIENFNDPAKLERYTKLAELMKSRSAYEEVYISNPVLARLVTTKFHDNAIFFADKISDKNADDVMRKTIDFFFIALPQPLLDKLGIDIEKVAIQRYSIGDLLSHYANGTVLGGLRTGSIFGQGLLLFGNFFILIYFLMCLVLFSAIDIFSKRTTDGLIIISAIGMLNLWQNFLFGITADSFHALFIGVVRGVLQSAFLYFIAISIAKLFTKAFSSKSQPIHSQAIK
jgi:hypothetical protein